ncbi:DUF418 domain-containing protein [Longirhabdus pacifica]|uniref:DUF418 domain-containing protein n=1 Tax=Longirhabdus pacifica TaxID=2305227 RepID=UPI0010087A70|nr:DUF418 domain-containing protein [Longirhabdus pacifica]
MNKNPTQSHERIISLDIIRGFALIGILLVNMPTFHTPDVLAALNGIPLLYEGTDHLLRLLLDMFVQTKFYPIFSFLFGLGAFMFMSRTKKGLWDHHTLYKRRMLVLLAFGLCHLIIFWSGDILTTYALAGLLLLCFEKVKNKTLLYWAAFFFIFMTMTTYLLTPSTYPVLDAYGVSKLNEAIDMYRYSSFAELLRYRWNEEVVYILFLNTIFSIMNMLPWFLLGMYSGRIGLFKHSDTHMKWIQRVWWTSLLLSLFPLTYMVIVYLNGISSTYVNDLLAVELSGMTLSIWYIASIVLLLQKKVWQKICYPLSYFGRMAFTNYLTQTLLCYLIFVVGGYYGQVSLVEGTWIALGILALQMIWSWLWLKQFRFGPLEWLWRSLTYGQLQPLKRNK